MTLHPQYLTDAKGRRTAVLLPYSEYEMLIEGKAQKTVLKTSKPKKNIGTANDDWFDSLSIFERKSLLKGLQDIKKGDMVSGKKVDEKVKILLKKAK